MSRVCIHQIWIQGEEHFKKSEPEFYKFSLNWKLHYPQYEYKLWSEEDYLPILEAYSSDLVASYHSAPSFSAKSDIARYAILHSNSSGCEGGLYADTDYESIKPCSFLFDDDNIEMAVVAMNLTPNKLLFGDYRYGTAWMYGKQGSKYLKRLLDRFCKIPYDPKKHTPFQYAWEVTGPKGFGDVVLQYEMEKDPTIRILPHSMIEVADFSNLAITYESKEFILNKFPFAVGIHRCNGSWIKNAQGLKATFGRFYAWVTSWSDFIHIGLLVVPLLILLNL
jgi:mannosyltransferase OCH1-like enzyme